MLSIENDELSAGVLPTGAELCSLRDSKTNTEYIWQADPNIWNSHAPILFPIIGILKNGEYYYESKRYEMPKHGIVRHNKNLKLTRRSESSLTLELMSSEKTLKDYPFRFQFQIEFTLDGRTLHINHTVSNLDDRPMYFSLGGHPAFNVPLYQDETYNDYYLQFDRKMDLSTHVLNGEGLVTNQERKLLENDDKIKLHKHLFDNDALIFKNIPSKRVTLQSSRSGQILKVDYSDFRNLGVWAKPAAPFLCIEPWLGIADVEGTVQHIKTKEGIIELLPSLTFDASYAITIA